MRLGGLRRSAPALGVRKQVPAGLTPSVLLIFSTLGFSPFVLSAAGWLPKYSTSVLLPIILLGAIFRNGVSEIRFGMHSRLMLGVLLFQTGYVAFLASFDATPDKFAVIANYAFLVVLYTAMRAVDPVLLAKVYVRMMLIILFFSAVSFISALMGLVDPVAAFNRNEQEVVYYLLGSFSPEIYRIGDHWLVRPSGLFMEPGALGLYTILAVLLNKSVEHVAGESRKKEIALLTLGAFSLSFGYYVSVIVYLAINYTKRVNVLRILSSLALPLAVFAAAVAAIFAAGSITTFTDLILSRFSFDPEYLFKGMAARSEMTNAAMELLSEAPIFGVGYERVSASDIQASIMGSVAAYGVAGFAVRSAHVWLALGSAAAALSASAARHRGRFLFSAIILISMNLYHRPFFNAPLYCVVVLCLFDVLADTSARKFAEQMPAQKV